MRGGFPGTESLNLTTRFIFPRTTRTTFWRLTAPPAAASASFCRAKAGDGRFLPAGFTGGPATSSGVSLMAAQPRSSDLRSEYVRSSGTERKRYWIESVYRLSQISSLRRLELVGRGQQFFAASNLSAATVKKLGASAKTPMRATSA